MTPLVLIPGMMCDARLFAPQIAAMNRRPVMIAPCTEADRVETIAAQILNASPPRFALAGLSMGGIVAMEVLRQAPGRVDRVALLDTNPKAEAEVVQASRAPQITRALGGDLAGLMRDEVLPNLVAPDAADRDGILALGLRMALDLGPEVFARQSRALASRPDQQETLAAWPGPALILCGAEDRLCPVHRHELMHRLMRDARLVVIEGAGHLPTLEKPEETTAALVEWLARGAS